MKSYALAALVAASSLLAVGNASAQTYSFNWSPRTGDTWVDSALGDMNRYGTQNRTSYINEMVRYYGAPRSLVTSLLADRWAPGDIYYACSVAKTLGRPCSYVTSYWTKNHGKGWGAVAKDLGIKPGSAQFHNLKKGFVPTYGRWGRTITLSDDLRRDYPNHGKKAQTYKSVKTVKSNNGSVKKVSVKKVSVHNGHGSNGNKPVSHGNGHGKK